MNDSLEIHPRLVEETVWVALQGRVEARAFHQERETVYGLSDREERERVFTRLHLEWFDRLALGEPFRQACLEQARALARVRRFVAGPAARARDEGADLFVADQGESAVVVSIRPEVLADRERALELLRRDLMHVADMLDPAFRYEPRLPPSPAGPAHDRLLQERYRVLWSCSVDGRLVALRRVSEAMRAFREREFARAFCVLGERVGTCFGRIFDGPRPGHPEMVSMASDPPAAFGLRPGAARPSGRCALCAFPTADLEPSPALMPEVVARAIRADFPEWRAENGLCPQCADLYRARTGS